MKIRSVTCFYDPCARNADQHLRQLGKLAREAKEQFGAAGYEVQTIRLATIPFPQMVPTCCDESAVRLAVQMEMDAREQGFDYLSFGPATTDEAESYRLIPAMLSATETVFLSASLTSGSHVNLDAVWAAARIVFEAARITPDGFTNLRFAALANVPAGSPFFPAAYHQAGTPPAFALALESADVAVTALGGEGSVEERRKRWLETLELHTVALQKVAESLSNQFGIRFGGFDFSPAPFPDASCSLGGAIESLSGVPLGSSGSLAAAAICAETLDRGTWLRTGFNGLMLPVLEDSILAKRAAEGSLTVKDLLMYSAVCGTGLDTVPLPGDADVGSLAALLLDVAALAVRLNKPLTARLMPVPGKAAGEPVVFDFAYFAPGAVMALPVVALTGPLAGGGSVDINPRRQ